MDIGKSSPRPWRYNFARIEDAYGGVIVERVGRIDGPLIVAAVNAYDPERDEAFKAMREALVECYVEVQEARAELFSCKAYPSGELDPSDQEELERLQAVEKRAKTVLATTKKQEAWNG